MPKAADFSAIYGSRHIASGRIYVGSAVRTNARWNRGTVRGVSVVLPGLKIHADANSDLCAEGLK